MSRAPTLVALDGPFFWPFGAFGRVDAATGCAGQRSRAVARSGGPVVCQAVQPGGLLVINDVIASICLFPPHPLTMENRPVLGITRRARGGGDRFFQCRAMERLRLTRGLSGCLPARPRGCKGLLSTGSAQNPRVGVFFPRVGRFLPRVTFCGFDWPISSKSFFLLIKERDREGKSGVRAIHGFLRCLKKRPRVCY